MTNEPTAEQIEAVARALYEADCALDPIEPRVPEWGRGGFKTQVMFWNGMARAAILAMQARQPAPAMEGRGERRCRIQDALLATLGETYDCTRVWSAWGYGTMGEDDFVPVLNRLEELIDEIDAAVAGELA